MKNIIVSEEPVLLLRPSAIYAFLDSLPFMALAILFLALAYVLFGAFVWVGLTWMLLAIYHFFSVRATRYIIGQETIMVRNGLFSVRLDSLELYRVRDYVIERPLIHRVFRLMDLTLMSTEQGDEALCLKGIPVSDILDTIRYQVQQARLKNHIVELT